MFEKVWVTDHTKGTKLAGIQSINTSVVLNPICQKRSKNPNSVCAKCYAENLLRMRKALAEHLEENTHILTMPMNDIQIATVPVSSYFVRIESFGDVANVEQCKNYIRIINAHPMQQFGAWTKNIGLWARAFEELGKPANLSMVFSSPRVNERGKVEPKYRKWIDHRFTVWTKAEYERRRFAGGCTACAGISCISQCGCKCYKKDTSFDIDEQLR